MCVLFDVDCIDIKKNDYVKGSSGQPDEKKIETSVYQIQNSSPIICLDDADNTAPPGETL